MIIDLKIYPENFKALYWFLIKNKAEVKQCLETRHAIVSQTELVLLCLADKYHSAKYQAWDAKNSSKLYSFNLTISEAFAIIHYCIDIKYNDNPALYSLISNLHARVTNFVSPSVFDQYHKLA